MDIEDMMKQLESLGTGQTKKTLMRHGAPEPLFGVRIGDLKKLVKHVKKNQELALRLYDTGNYDAMYLAGLSVDPKRLTKEQLRDWASKANCHTIAECTVAAVAAESAFALELANEWMASEEELIASCGWNTMTHYISVTPDEELDLDALRVLLRQVSDRIHEERNRVRYTMNGFVIGVGSFVKPLAGEAAAVAEKIGKVSVDVGDTACKVPVAADYIRKVEAAGKLGAKRKTCIC